MAEPILPDSAGVTFDKYGRMNYHPDYHGRQNAPWTTTEQQFLIDNYAALGPEQVGMALERTIHTVMTRAYELRKQGLMAKPAKRSNHKRLRALPSTEEQAPTAPADRGSKPKPQKILDRG